MTTQKKKYKRSRPISPQKNMCAERESDTESENSDFIKKYNELKQKRCKNNINTDYVSDETDQQFLLKFIGNKEWKRNEKNNRYTNKKICKNTDYGVKRNKLCAKNLDLLSSDSDLKEMDIFVDVCKKKKKTLEKASKNKSKKVNVKKNLDDHGDFSYESRLAKGNFKEENDVSNNLNNSYQENMSKKISNQNINKNNNENSSYEENLSVKISNQNKNTDSILKENLAEKISNKNINTNNNMNSNHENQLTKNDIKSNTIDDEIVSEDVDKEINSNKIKNRYFDIKEFLSKLPDEDFKYKKVKMNRKKIPIDEILKADSDELKDM